MRAIRRCGELLKQFDAQGRRTDQLDKGGLTKSQKEAAVEGGMSLHQQRTAVRVANVPADTFERKPSSKPLNIHTK